MTLRICVAQILRDRLDGRLLVTRPDRHHRAVLEPFGPASSDGRRRKLAPHGNGRCSRAGRSRSDSDTTAARAATARTPTPTRAQPVQAAQHHRCRQVQIAGSPASSGQYHDESPGLRRRAATRSWTRLSASPALQAEMESLDRNGGPLHSSQRAMIAVFRPDLSYRPLSASAVGKSRYFGVATIPHQAGPRARLRGLPQAAQPRAREGQHRREHGGLPGRERRSRRVPS